MEERLQKLISASGLTSRRGAEDWITAGRVTVNGRVAALGDKADLSRDQVLVDGRPLPRRGVCPVQLIQQHPEQAVDPRLRMRKTLAEAGEVPQQLLDDLGIREEWLQRFPHELSGGELQRFCIARALATRPRYLICDEVSTMLDAVTQAHIWRVLLAYAERERAGMLLVSHTPALTNRIATRTLDLTKAACR